jgi:voltage-gated potassium channel
VTTTVILEAVGQLAQVTADAVAGALCGYLLIGAGFGHAYALIEVLAPGSFVGTALSADPRDPGRTHAVLTYFSVSTLTTVGYGDVTPASGVTRGLANVEAIVGQFYLAVVIADLIGKRVARQLAAPPRPDAPAPAAKSGTTAETKA